MRSAPQYLPGGLFPSPQRCSLSGTDPLAELGDTLASPWTPGRKYFRDSSPPELRGNPPTSSPLESGGWQGSTSQDTSLFFKGLRMVFQWLLGGKERGTRSEAWVCSHRYLDLALGAPIHSSLPPPCSTHSSREQWLSSSLRNGLTLRKAKLFM